MASADQVQMIVQGAKQRGIDPFAAIAVAQQEGLGGGIGDGGHAFGPFQLNDAGGAFPATTPSGQSTAGWSTDQRQAWAWSAEGIGYALDRIASVAKGQVGQSAVMSIVYRFERPRDPASEARKAAGAYTSLFRSAAGRIDRLPIAMQKPTAAGFGGGLGSLGDLTPSGAVSNIVGDVIDGAGGVTGLVEAPIKTAQFLGKISSVDFLLRAGQVVGGAVLILVGVVMLARQVGLSFDPPKLPLGNLPVPPIPE